MHSDTHYVLTLKDGTIYETDAAGAVLARSDGPKGFDYSGKWIVLGASTRFNAHHIVTLAEIVNGADFGQGWIHDLDHGTHRVWGNPSSRRLKSVYRVGQ